MHHWQAIMGLKYWLAIVNITFILEIYYYLYLEFYILFI